MDAHDDFYLAAAVLGFVFMFAFVLLHFLELVCNALQPHSRYPPRSVTQFTTPFYLFSLLFSCLHCAPARLKLTSSIWSSVLPCGFIAQLSTSPNT
jgi:hypothetical protein